MTQDKTKELTGKLHIEYVYIEIIVMCYCVKLMVVSGYFIDEKKNPNRGEKSQILLTVPKKQQQKSKSFFSLHLPGMFNVINTNVEVVETEIAGLKVPECG